MNAGALILMLGTWIAVAALTAFCFYKVLKHRQRKE